MPSGVANRIERSIAWPMTPDAWDRLIDETTGLRHELSTMSGQGLEEGALYLPLVLAERRLETLRAVMDRCQVIDDAQCAAIGRRAKLRDADGELMSFEIVFPGDGDPDKGWVSADSPLGGAILGARAGDVVHVTAPGGSWSVTVVSVQ
jgi:transcription elongation GreA/GreB family factor